MARSTVRVTRVSPGDEAEVADLWVQSCIAQGSSPGHTERAAREGRLQTAAAREDVRIFLATVEGTPVGFSISMAGPVSALSEDVAVWIDVLWVLPGRRGRGVAKALLATVAGYADALGATEIVSCVPAASRDAQRFFARLGFANVITERTISPAVLRRRLSGQHRPNAVADAVRRRRSLRAGRAAPVGAVADLVDRAGSAS